MLTLCQPSPSAGLARRPFVTRLFNSGIRLAAQTSRVSLMKTDERARGEKKYALMVCKSRVVCEERDVERSRSAPILIPSGRPKFVRIGLTNRGEGRGAEVRSCLNIFYLVMIASGEAWMSARIPARAPRMHRGETERERETERGDRNPFLFLN